MDPSYFSYGPPLVSYANRMFAYWSIMLLLWSPDTFPMASLLTIFLWKSNILRCAHYDFLFGILYFSYGPTKRFFRESDIFRGAHWLSNGNPMLLLWGCYYDCPPEIHDFAIVPLRISYENHLYFLWAHWDSLMNNHIFLYSHCVFPMETVYFSYEPALNLL